MHAPGDTDPPSGRLPQQMTQRFPAPTRLSLQVLAPSQAGNQPADSLRQQITGQRGPESTGRKHPSAHGPDPSCTADPVRVEGWERDHRAQMLPGGSSRNSERLSVPSRGKSQKASQPRQLLIQAILELSALSGQLHRPKRPCRNRWDRWPHPGPRW